MAFVDYKSNYFYISKCHSTMRIYTYVLATFIAILFFTACKEETEYIEPTVYSYSPIDSGKYITYIVDSILYNDYERTIDTHTYYMRYEYGREELDARGETFNRYEQYIKSDLADEWVLAQVFAIKNINNQLHVIEDNQRIVRLTYPIVENKYWDGLPYIRRDTSIEIPGGSINLYKDWGNFSYEQSQTPFQINNLTFENTVLVVQVNNENNIERRYSIERYAEGIGLIEKEMWILDTQCNGNIANCLNTPWEEKAEKGFILRQRIIEHNF